MRLKPSLVPVAIVAVVAAVAVGAVPAVSFAQHGDLTHQQAAVPNAAVGFGVLATAPLGPAPCLQANVPNGATIGGPGDPCAYKIHHLTPEEVTILKGGQVTFQINGGGHAMAIYEVSKDTTRDGIGHFLCPGTDPATIADPTLHKCGPLGDIIGNAAKEHLIGDGRGNVVIVASPNVTGVHPDNRVWYEPGRLMSAGGVQFLNAPGTTGQLVTYRFLKTGRYLVICINRSHFLNDWMFGFVNVTGQ
jgi:hypothetical protein